jgi:transcriptional regulator with XRE-family HTH domain
VGERTIQSVRTAEYDLLIAMLREARELKAVSQRQLSKRLGREHTYILKIEKGIRRVDVVEMIQICSELGVDPLEIVAKVRDSIKVKQA